MLGVPLLDRKHRKPFRLVGAAGAGSSAWRHRCAHTRGQRIALIDRMSGDRARWKGLRRLAATLSSNPSVNRVARRVRIRVMMHPNPRAMIVAPASS